MELEEFISGYCRCLDGSRTVTVECFDGETEIDCNYGNCPYDAECTIARRIKELLDA